MGQEDPFPGLGDFPDRLFFTNQSLWRADANWSKCRSVSNMRDTMCGNIRPIPTSDWMVARCDRRLGPGGRTPGGWWAPDSALPDTGRQTAPSRTQGARQRSPGHRAPPGAGGGGGSSGYMYCSRVTLWRPSGQHQRTDSRYCSRRDGPH